MNIDLHIQAPGTKTAYLQVAASQLASKRLEQGGLAAGRRTKEQREARRSQNPPDIVQDVELLLASPQQVQAVQNAL